MTTSEEIEQLVEKRKMLTSYFNGLKEDLKIYPINSPEYDRIYTELSSTSIELSFIKRALIDKRFRLDYLRTLAGDIILGKENTR